MKPAEGRLHPGCHPTVAPSPAARPQLGTEVCLVLLLFGNLCGDLCLLADMGSIAAQELFPGGAPGWLVAGGGRALMAVLAAVVVFPLSCVRHMREVRCAPRARAR